VQAFFSWRIYFESWELRGWLTPGSRKFRRPEQILNTDQPILFGGPYGGFIFNGLGGKTGGLALALHCGVKKYPLVLVLGMAAWVWLAAQVPVRAEAPNPAAAELFHPLPADESARFANLGVELVRAIHIPLQGIFVQNGNLSEKGGEIQISKPYCFLKFARVVSQGPSTDRLEFRAETLAAQKKFFQADAFHAFPDKLSSLLRPQDSAIESAFTLGFEGPHLQCNHVNSSDELQAVFGELATIL
jgi:hypothetical protein